MSRALRWVVVIVVTMIVALLAFAVIIKIQPPGWQSREYSAMLVWSFPLGFVVLGVARILLKVLRGRGPIAQASGLVIGALVSAITWTGLAVVLTGGYALAFDANPLWCWTAASLAGMGMALFALPERIVPLRQPPNVR